MGPSLIAITVKGAAEARRKLQSMTPLLAAATARSMARAVKYMEADLKKNALTGQKGHDSFLGTTGAPEPTLGVRSGMTRRSVTSEVVVKTSAPVFMVGAVGSPMKHLRILEEGGDIHGSPYLRIPLAAAQTRAGVDRFAGVKKVPGAFILRSRHGNLFVALRSRGSFPTLLYLLKRSVHIHARHMWRESMRRTEGEVRNLFAEGVRVSITTGRAT